MRSRAAAAILAGAGFTDVASMAGGIRAWDGLVAEGPPEAGMAHFAAATGPAELATLAWQLEAGSRLFYAGVAGSTDDRASALLFADLARAEERHMEALRGLLVRLAGPDAPAAVPGAPPPPEAPGAIMEGGVEVAEGLAWSRGKSLDALLEYCISLETNSYDLYLRMRAASRARDAREVFDLLADEERRHLARLTARFEQVDAGGAPA